MVQQPFTSTGADAKIAELYALSDTDLLIQADLIRSDFRSWIKNNFILDTSQVAYLTGVDDTYISYIAQSLGMAVQNRLEVTLTTPSSGSTGARISKWIESGSTLNAKYDGSGGVTATGKLAFSVYYG